MEYSMVVGLMVWITTLFGQSEAHYITLLAGKLEAASEVRVSNGRVDLVSATHAIEVEWAPNWKHSIGQALWYALNTNKKPGIILLMKSIDDRKYGMMLSSALTYAELDDKIEVWYYPEDFGESFQQVSLARDKYKQTQITNSGHFTRNRNSGVRHNSSCTYYNCDNCVPCGPTDGKRGCGKCGG